MIIDTLAELWNRFDPLGGFICAICAGYERRLGGGGTEAGRAARIKFLDSAVNGGIRENRAGFHDAELPMHWYTKCVLGSL